MASSGQDSIRRSRRWCVGRVIDGAFVAATGEILGRVAVDVDCEGLRIGNRKVINRDSKSLGAQVNHILPIAQSVLQSRAVEFRHEMGFQVEPIPLGLIL